MKIRAFLILLTLTTLFFGSCNYFDFTPKEGREVVARVNTSYLYEEDISDLTSKNTSKEDSILIVTNFIDRWATQQLLIDRAKLNINLERQERFNALVKDYHNQLYTKAYTDAIVIKALDSVVSQDELQAYYEENKESFSLNEDLYKLRYIRTEGITPEFYSLKRELTRFNKEDKDTLMTKISGLRDYNLNDSVWNDSSSLFRELPVLASAEDYQLSRADRYLQLNDSLGVYMIYIKDILKRGEQAPLSYVKGTVTQIILNKRRQELIKNLKKEITKDAIKNKEFELYN